ncbi:zinc finger SWIM domain-containing protein 7-like isoform X2 [Haliotis asinina]|uniref:zinc finger SWIM domain-containing protein 7-like isoform X2 n=1 Tax=Haliotis asinina TaxID=109174 RepID=UPI003532665D
MDGFEDVVSAVGQQLLGEVERVYSAHGRLTDEILSSLQFVFQGPLLPALDLVDRKAVSIITSPSGRSLYQVMGSSGTPYTCFTSSTYCSCPSYRFSVLLKEVNMMCKHRLAILLSKRMGLIRTASATDQELSSMIVQMDFS